MKKHRGQILRKVINNLGIKIQEVARQMNVSRGTIYNYFKEPDLDNKTLIAIGRILRYDFSIHFNELIPLKKQQEDENQIEEFGPRTTKELCVVQRKYYKLLENNNTLLKFLVEIACKEELVEIRKNITQFTDKHLENKNVQKPPQ